MGKRNIYWLPPVHTQPKEQTHRTRDQTTTRVRRCPDLESYPPPFSYETTLQLSRTGQGWILPVLLKLFFFLPILKK